MAESKITVARVKDKVGGKEAEVSKLLYSDNGNIKTIGGDSAITVNSAKTLNGETKEQLLRNVNASTIDGKRLAEIQSRGKFGPIKLLMGGSNAEAYNYTMVVTEDEDIFYCGYNHVTCLVMNKIGNIGIPWTLLPNPLKGISKIKQIVGDYLSQFLLYENGDLYARGNNEYYTLGIGNTANQFNWVKVTDNVKKLCLAQTGYYGARSSAAVLKNDGSVWFWGENAYGQAGMGNLITLQVPTKVSLAFLQDGDKVKDVWLSDSYYTSSFIITEKGKLYSCGYNVYGELGLNDKTNRSTFTLVSTLQDKIVESISGSVSYTSSSVLYSPLVIAKCKDNSYYAWGTTTGWKVSKATNNSDKPVLIDNTYFTSFNAAQDPIIDMRVFGIGSIYAITKSGRLFVAGYNSTGQLGTGNTIDVNNPIFTEVKIPNAKVKAIWGTMNASQAQYCSVILLVEIDGKKYLYGAGYSAYGNIGTNSANDTTPTFTQVILDSNKVENIKELYVGGFQNVGMLRILLNNGQYWACGYNAYSQVLGTGVYATPICFPLLVL